MDAAPSIPSPVSPPEKTKPAPRVTFWNYLRYKRQWVRILWHVGTGFLVGLAFGFLAERLGRSYLGQLSREASYYYLVNRIGAMADNARLAPVTVVDLGRFTPTPDARTGTVATDLAGLARLLDEILKAEPAAVGIDVDLSARPTEVGQRFPAGFAQLMRSAVEARYADGTPIPVALAVARNADQPSRIWLGNEEFAPLAAGVAAEIPVFALPFALRSAAAGEPLPGLAAKMAGRGNSDTVRPQPIPAWLGRNPEPAPHSPVIDQYLVNYVRLAALQQAAIPAGTDGNRDLKLFADRLRGQVVLLGDVTHGADLVRVPGQIAPVPGVLVHACGVDTLLRSPLFEVGPRVGSLIAWVSSLLGVSVFLTFTFLAYRADVLAGRIRDWESVVPRTRTRGIALSMILGLGGMFFTVLIAVVLALFGYIWLEVWLGTVLAGAQMLVEIARAEIPVPRAGEVVEKFLDPPPKG